MLRIIDRYNVVVMEYPQHGCRGSVGKFGDGYLVLVDPDLREEVKMKTIEHELLHVMLGHLDARSYLTQAEREYEVKEMLRR